MKNSIIPVQDKHMVGSPIGHWIVLWAIREKGPLSFRKLYELVYGSQEFGLSELNFLKRTISDLHSLGFIQASENSQTSLAFSNPEVTIEKTDLVDLVQYSFGISITDYAAGKGEQISIDPIFGRPNTRKKDSWPEVFVLMPFAAEMRPIYDDHILKVTKNLRISCERCDDFFSTESIISEIWTAIFKASICIADCTGKNPNVFYELGLSHTLGRPTIVISQSTEDVPFDIRHRRFILYEYTPRGMKEFENKLMATLLAELHS
jgi:hypothetical protein